MLEYSANEIMNRAEQYANKENSAVYSYAEKKSMLNEAWQELYQILINTGDKYWINTFSFKGKTVALPKDLYQIAEVKKDNEKVTDYELSNNELKFKYDGKYVVEYYPNPQTLSFKMKIKKSVYQDAGYRSGRDGLYLHSNSLYNSLAKSNTTISGLNPSDYMNIYSNCVLANVPGTQGKRIYSFKTEETESIGTPVVYNDTVFNLKADGKIYSDVDEEVASYTKTGNPSFIVTKDFNSFIEINGYIPKIVNDGFVYIKNSQLIHSDWDGNESLIYTKFKPVGYEDNMLITHDSLSSMFYNESINNDTIISYPSNVYITILALAIAIKMRAKQGIDNTQLDTQYQMAMSTLFNTIDRDKNKCIVIKDVYNNKGNNSIFR